jgi:predicted Co/Zn/Cd cation transporter (cation efflux family)
VSPEGGSFSEPDVALPGSSIEVRKLGLSVVVSLAIAIFAFGWGVAFESRVVLFDGIFILLGTVMSYLALRASKAADAGPTAAYPYGRESLTPFVVGLQGVVTLGTTAYAVSDAVLVIVNGGSDTAAGAVAVYAAVATGVSVVVWRHLLGADPDSDLLQVEARGWRAGAILSGVVLLGALLGILLGLSPASDLVVYLDPVLLIVASLVVLPRPISMIRTMWAELGEQRAPADVMRLITALVEEVRARHGLPEPDLRVTKVGRKLYVDAEFLVDGGGWTLEDEDSVRRDVARGLAELPYEVWRNVALTSDPRLLE